MKYTAANAYYVETINPIGGIESHLYYLAKKYGKYDITVFYQNGDPAQLVRLRQYVRCIRISPADYVTCENLFCCLHREILDYCDAKKKYVVLHANYLDLVNRRHISKQILPVDDRIDAYLGVSREVCKAWEELTGIPAEFIGEPVLPDDGEPLMLMSATRLSKEKGWERMKILAEAMNKEKINFLWFVFTDSKMYNPPKNMYILPSRIDIAEKMSGFDAYVQLSDNEGFCLSVAEALLKGIPVIVTDLPIFTEIGCTEANSIRLPLGMSNIPLDKIKALKRLKFAYTEPEDRWLKYLKKTKSNYQATMVTIRATGVWMKRGIVDVQLGKVPSLGEEWSVDEERFNHIQDYADKIGEVLIEIV